MKFSQPMFAGMACAALTACVAVVPVPVALTRAVAADMVPVTYRDRAFTAQIVPGAAGVRLTNAGAQPVAGSTVRVRAAGLGQDEGIAAKEVARQACEGQGGVFQAQAIGGYVGPQTWAFAGACT